VRLILLASDFYLLGLGVTVALVTYPSFYLVGEAQWSTYHAAHGRRMTWAVAPAWLLQGVSSLWWLLRGVDRGFALGHGAFALLGVLLTVFGAIPCHQRLTERATHATIRHLELWHWTRTLAWLGCCCVGATLL
jgi:hypothetical protein